MTGPALARRTVPALRGATAAGALLALAACSVLPAMPPPVPADIVPSASAPGFADGATDNLSPDGFDTVQRMAVRVRNVGCDALSTGSGFAVDEHTLITNRHVVAGSESLQVSTYDGRDIEVAAASAADLADLALVRTQDALPSFPDVSAEDPERGDEVTVVGYPSGGQLTVTTGKVVGSTTDPLHENLGEVLVTDAVVEPGSSGSAVLDDAGEVIGVVYAKTSDGRSLVVPASTLRDLLADASAFTAVPAC